MRVVCRAAALGIFAFGFSTFTGHAFAQTYLWDHNGSLMRFDRKEKKRRFVYQEPRKTLESAGVKSGTILFEGEEKKNGRLAGYAKLFRNGCDPVDYFVEGAYDKVGGEIVLQGQTPVYSGDGCKITGYSDNGSASTLKFTRLGDAPEAVIAAPVQPEAEPDEQPSIADEAVRHEPRSRSRYADRTYPPPPPAYQRDRSYEYDEAEEDERSFAYQHERRGRRPRYDGTYYGPGLADEEPYDYDAYDEEDEDEEPAYRPYQPRWRRHVY